ncbi:monocarboxylate transporter 5-like [Dermacentor andersoni]|uniref:monocarboxylate transporter 5-like n=1 Tax=Dermacentor andersoni TaxID=34620 RepID=UPI003B3B0265
MSDQGNNPPTERARTLLQGHMYETDKDWHVTIVAAAAFFFGSASIRSSGIFYLSIMEEFRVCRSTASWPDTLIDATSEMAGKRLLDSKLSGPNGYDTDKPGGQCLLPTRVAAARRLLVAVFFERVNPLGVMTVGSILAWAGVMCSALAPSIVWISLTLGVTHGIGIGLVFSSLQVFLSQNFSKYRGTAHGIMYAGAAASAMVFPYLLEYTTHVFGFRLSLVIFGLILVNLTIITLLLDRNSWVDSAATRQEATPGRTARGSLYKSTSDGRVSSTTAVHAESSLPEPGSPSHTNIILREGRVFSCPMYYVILGTWILFNYCFDMFIGTIDDYATDKQLGFLKTISILPIISTTDIFGGVCLPALVDKGLLSRSALLSTTYLGLGVTTALLPVMTAFLPFVGVCLVLAMFMGSGNAMYGVLQADYIRQDRLPVSYGTAGFVAGILLIAKPFVIGYFRDYHKSYDGLFRMLSVILLFLGLSWLVVVVYEWHVSGSWKRKKRRQAVIGILQNL